MKRRKKFDPTRMPPLDSGSIVIDADSLSMQENGIEVFNLKWSRVTAIFTYTHCSYNKFVRDCIVFAYVGRPGAQCLVHENLEGWSDVCAAIIRLFPLSDPDWYERSFVKEDKKEILASLDEDFPNTFSPPHVVWSAKPLI